MTFGVLRVEMTYGRFVAADLKDLTMRSEVDLPPNF